MLVIRSTGLFLGGFVLLLFVWAFVAVGFEVFQDSLVDLTSQLYGGFSVFLCSLSQITGIARLHGPLREFCEVGEVFLDSPTFRE